MQSIYRAPRPSILTLTVLEVKRFKKAPSLRKRIKRSPSVEFMLMSRTTGYPSGVSANVMCYMHGLELELALRSKDGKNGQSHWLLLMVSFETCNNEGGKRKTHLGGA